MMFCRLAVVVLVSVAAVVSTGRASAAAGVCDPPWPANAPVAAWQGSIQASLQAASPGSVVVVPSGTYPGQTVTYAGSPVVCSYVDASGATFGTLEMDGAQGIYIRGAKLTGLFNVRLSTLNSNVPSARISRDLVFEDFDGKTFLFRNVERVRVLGGSFGGWDASITPLGPPKIGAYVSSSGAPARLSTDVLIERTVFHDMTRTITGTAHAECLYFDAGTDGVTIRDSTFTNCAVFDIFSNGNAADRPITNVLIESNLLDVPRDTGGAAAASAIDFKGGASNVTIRGNSILGNVRVDADGAPYPGWLTDKNAIGGTGGSGTDVMGPDPGFVAASKSPCDLSACFRNDLHVLADSAAGRAGAGVPVTAPPPPPPPPACAGDTLPLTVVAQDMDTVTFGWAPVDGAVGYRFNSTVLGAKWPHTWDANRSTVKFAKGSECYRVQALGVIADGGAAGVTRRTSRETA